MIDEERAVPQDDEEDYEPDILTLEDEDGVQHTFEVMDAADVDDVHYLAVVPFNENAAESLDEDAEMLIMRMGENDGEEYLDVVDDEEELLRVGEVFIKRLSEVFDIDLDDLKRDND